MSIIATPLQERCTESAHFVIFVESKFAHDFSPTTIYNIYRDAIYIHVFKLRKILDTDYEHQYAIIVYRRNVNTLISNKELLVKFTNAIIENTHIGAFCGKKLDILTTLRERAYSEKCIGNMIYKTDVVWGDPQATYALRHNKNRRDTNMHKYWVLEGCPAYYVSDFDHNIFFLYLT